MTDKDNFHGKAVISSLTAVCQAGSIAEGVPAPFWEISITRDMSLIYEEAEKTLNPDVYIQLQEMLKVKPDPEKVPAWVLTLNDLPGVGDRQGLLSKLQVALMTKFLWDAFRGGKEDRLVLQRCQHKSRAQR